MKNFSSHIFIWKIPQRLQNNLVQTPHPCFSQTLSHHLVIQPPIVMPRHQDGPCCFSPPFNTDCDFHRSNVIKEGKDQPLTDCQASCLSLLFPFPCFWSLSICLIFFKSFPCSNFISLKELWESQSQHIPFYCSAAQFTRALAQIYYWMYWLICW